MRARNGDGTAMDALMRRYTGFVRLKSSSYFLAGGDSEDLDGGAAEPHLLPRHRAVVARSRRAAPLPRRRVLRGDGGAARVRHEDDRQRTPAREAQDHHAPEGARSPAVARATLRSCRSSSVVEHLSCKEDAVGSIPTSGLLS